jgi:hypothetical protein
MQQYGCLGHSSCLNTKEEAPSCAIQARMRMTINIILVWKNVFDAKKKVYITKLGRNV